MNSLIFFLALGLMLSSVGAAQADGVGGSEANATSQTPATVGTQSATLVSTCASPVAGNTTGMASDGSFLWIIGYDSRKAYKVDPATCQAVSSIGLPGTYPFGLAWDGAALWHSDRVSNKIYRLNPADGTILTSFASPSLATSGLAYDGATLWNNSFTSPAKTYRITTADTVLTSFAAPGPTPSGLTYDGENLWLADNASRTLYKLNPQTFAVLASFAAPGTIPNGLAWDGRYLWIIDNGTHKLYQYDVGVPTAAAIGNVGLKDVTENGAPELALLTQASGAVAPTVTLRDSKTNALIRTITFLNKNYIAKSLAVVPDMDNSGTDEIAVMAVNRLTLRPIQEIRDSANGLLIKSIAF